MSRKIFNIFKAILFLYIFLLSIHLMGDSFKLFGKGFARALITTTSHPIVSLFIGILATSIIQSSSTTTSMIVSLCSCGALTIHNAVPMVMGANIGTTVTNTIVSFAQITRKDEFERGFSAALVHDFFNITIVAIFLPLEMMTGFLQKIATFSANLIAGSANVAFHSPIKTIVKPVGEVVAGSIAELVKEPVLGGVVLLVVSLIFLFLALWQLVNTMKEVALNKTEIAINNVIGKAPIIGILVGAVFTMIIQSSSITTSIMVPMAGAGLVTLATIFPITLGANIGTTFTAILASLAGNKLGLTIALVHLFFNTFGVMVIYPVAPIRNFFLRHVEEFSHTIAKNRKLAVVYVFSVFFLIPGLIIFLPRIF
ncbi:MAG: Na/Pi symporter [Spirochaetes bacterium]|nr:Na/Pi symporter [Spirochaetota bacterium]